VPGGPGADLVFVEAGQALAGLECFLDGPAPSSDADVVGEGDRIRAVAAVVGQLAGLVVAAHQQVVVAGVGVTGDLDQRPGIPALSFGAGPGAEALPLAAAQRSRELVHTMGPGGGGDRAVGPTART
jgi:hypothetical protein